jgi:hypothetical protein
MLAVFQNDAVTPSLPNALFTIEANALPHQFLGTLFGLFFFYAVTTVPVPEPVAPPPPDGITTIPSA